MTRLCWIKIELRGTMPAQAVPTVSAGHEPWVAQGSDVDPEEPASSTVTQTPSERRA